MGRKIIIGIAALFIAINALIVMVVVLRSSALPPPPALPNPNGYDDFVAGAGKVNGNLPDYAKMDHDHLATLVSNNADALTLMTAGLSKECRVPVDYSTNYAGATLLGQISSFKDGVRVFVAAGRFAELEGRTNDALKIYLDGVRYSQEISRGGLLISRLVSIACEAVVLKQLEPFAGNLDATNAAFLAKSLESIDSRAEPVAETIRQEKLWSQQIGGLQGRIGMLFMAKSIKKVNDNVISKSDAVTLHRRQIILEAAARAYELDKGQPPQTAADLIPAYLKAIPKDPVTGQELRVSR